MFFKKEEKKQYVGAKQKMQAARRSRIEGGDGGTSKVEGPEPTESLSIMLIFVASCLLAYLISENYMLESALFAPTGIQELDKIIGGAGYLVITGIEGVDIGITVFVRGLLIFILAGIVPFCTKMYVNITDNPKSNTLVRVWGTIVILFLLVVSTFSFFIPTFNEIMNF